MPNPRRPYRTFKDLEVWRESVELAVDVYRLTARFPYEERFGMTSQFRRAAVSVPTNLAEGYGRATPGEYLNQISVVRGSLNEVETLSILSARLEFGDQNALVAMAPRIEVLQRRITALRTSIERRRRP
jgi:four helix bundle protein